jgi:hypothetical protein
MLSCALDLVFILRHFMGLMPVGSAPKGEFGRDAKGHEQRFTGCRLWVGTLWLAFALESEMHAAGNVAEVEVTHTPKGQLGRVGERDELSGTEQISSKIRRGLLLHLSPMGRCRKSSQKSRMTQTPKRLFGRAGERKTKTKNETFSHVEGGETPFF